MMFDDVYFYRSHLHHEVETECVYMLRPGILELYPITEAIFPLQLFATLPYFLSIYIHLKWMETHFITISNPYF